MDRRVITLGDATTTVESVVATIKATTSDYEAGRLRGWIRDFTRGGVSYPDPGYPHSDAPPTLEEWAAFDEQAAALGLDGMTNAARAWAAKKARQGFLDKLKGAVRSLGRGDLIKAVSGTLNAVEGEIDKVVPGAGAFVGNFVINALTPLLPFAPALTTTLATVASNVPIVGPGGLGPIVRDLGSGGQKWFEGPHGYGTQLELPQSYQGEIQNAVAKAAVENASGAADALGPIKASLDRVIATYEDTKGPLLKKLEAVGTEVANEFAFAVTVACTVFTVGTATPACVALQTALVGLQAGLSVIKAQNAAKALKEASKKALQDGLAEAARLDAEAKAIAAEIARLRAERAQAERDAALGRSLLGAAAVVAGVALVSEVLS